METADSVDRLHLVQYDSAGEDRYSPVWWRVPAKWAASNFGERTAQWSTDSRWGYQVCRPRIYFIFRNKQDCDLFCIAFGELPLVIDRINQATAEMITDNC